MYVCAVTNPESIPMTDTPTTSPSSVKEQAIAFAHACWRAGESPRSVLTEALRKLVSHDRQEAALLFIGRLAPLMEADGVTLGDITGRSRKAPIKKWRSVTIWALRVHAGLPVIQIGLVFGRNHSTVLNASEVGRRYVHDTPGLLDRINQRLNP